MKDPIWKNHTTLLPQSGLLAAISPLRTLPLPGESREAVVLVFDSMQQRPGRAVRGGLSSARQLLYKSGSLCIDMHMRPKPGSISVALTGQILDSRRPAHAMRDIPVSLCCGEDPILRKTTNAFGEFDFGVDTAQGLQLVFGINERRKVVVPVPGMEVLGANDV